MIICGARTVRLVCICAGAAILWGGVAVPAPAPAAVPAPAAPAPAAVAAPAYDELLASEGARLGKLAGKPEAVSALAELAGLDQVVAPRALEAAVRGGLDPRAHPLVAAQAALLAAHLLDERGETREAEALRAPLGLVRHAFVIGPFGDGRSSFATAYPPEREPAPPALGRSYPGKTHEVGWRLADGAFQDGALYLDGLLRPDDQAVAYVVAFVHSDKQRPAALRLGSAGPIKVWLDGAPVLARDVVRPAMLDQDAAGVTLARGWNRILVKTVITDGAWRLYLRLTEPSGAPLPPGEVWDPGRAARLPRVEPAGRGGPVPARPAPRVVTLEALLERRARDAPPAARAEAWLDLGRALAFIAPRDRDERAAGMAFDRSLALGPSLGALLGAADVAAEDDDRRRILERASALDGVSPGWRALLLARLGDLARTERREARAMEAWRQALAIDPGCWTASLAMAEQEAETGLPLAALARLAALAPGAQALPRVQRAAARLYEAAGRRTEAERVLRDLARDRRVDVEVLHQLARWARARGDGEEARARLAAAAALRPDLASLDVELARLYEGAGEAPRALATLSVLARRLPDDPSTLIALGKLLHRMGKPDEALERLRAALKLRPQDPELKRYVDHLAAGARGDPTAADELARRYAEDASALVSPLPAGGVPADAAVVLLDRRVVRVHSNGLARTFAQRIVEVLTERGAEEQQGVRRPLHARKRGGRHPPGARLPARRPRGDAGPRGDRPQRRGSVGALVRPLLRQPGGDRALRRAAAGRRRGDPVPGGRRRPREPDGRLLRRSAVRGRGDPQAALGLHAHRPREPFDPHQRPARSGARARDLRRGRRPRLPVLGRQRRQDRLGARDAGVRRGRALPPSQHLRLLAGGGGVVLAPGRGAADRRRRDPQDRARSRPARHERRRPRARGL